jgi:hypothetical protein
LKQKAVTMAILVLLSTAILFFPLLIVLGQESPGVYVYQVTQQGSTTQITSGTVGLPVNLAGTILTQNGAYQIFFGDTLVDSKNASGYYVDSNFAIPELPGGNYNITLKDSAQYVYNYLPFIINSEYSVKAIVPQSPALLQEGNNIVLNVTVTGGQPNTSYAANVTVMLPSPLSTNYVKIVSFTSSTRGTAQAQITFPDSSFQPSGSTSIYTGLYTAFFNRTQGLGQSQFFIGFTDAIQYNKQDTVKINAAGYQPSQTASLKIQNQAGVAFSQNVTASNQGVITTTWKIPSTASVGEYTVTITPQNSPKPIPDQQTFNLPGYPVTIRALNLAGEVVPQLQIQAYDEASNTLTSGNTSVDGSVTMNLEKGNQSITAYWNLVKVGQTKITIAGNSTFDINCQLANLKIVVQDKNGFAIPFVDLRLKYQFITNSTGTTQTFNASGQTDILGTYVYTSLLPGINYAVDASKYGVVFNVGNNTINNLPAKPSNQVTVLCPDKTLTVTTVDYNLASLTNARMELVEQSRGIFYSASTGSTGTVSIQVTFGQYRLRIYTADNILLNETVINVLSNTQSQVRCALYNLQVSIKIVDYFGNPITNVNIQLSRSSMNTRSAITLGDGTATFDNVIGGDMQINAYPSGNEGAFTAENLYLDSPTTVQIKMANFVALGSIMIGTNLLAALLIMVIAVVVFLGFEVYRKTEFKLINKKGKQKGQY